MASKWAKVKALGVMQWRTEETLRDALARELDEAWEAGAAAALAEVRRRCDDYLSERDLSESEAPSLQLMELCALLAAIDAASVAGEDK